MSDRADEGEVHSPLSARWFHAREKEWSPFSPKDSTALEKAWQALTDEERVEHKRRRERERAEAEESRTRKREGNKGAEKMLASIHEGFVPDPSALSFSALASMAGVSGADWVKIPGNSGPSSSHGDFGVSSPSLSSKSLPSSEGEGEDRDERKQKGDTGAAAAPEWTPRDPNEPLPHWRVPVAEDALYEVDLKSMKLFPVFWKGAELDVLRATWFYDSAGRFLPVDRDLADDLEEAYRRIQPWQASYAEKMRAKASDQKDKKDEKDSDKDDQVVRLPSLKDGYVIFVDGKCARLYTGGIVGRLSDSIREAFSSVGGSLVLRGFDEYMRRRRGERDGKAKSQPKGAQTQPGQLTKEAPKTGAFDRPAGAAKPSAPQWSGRHSQSGDEVEGDDETGGSGDDGIGLKASNFSWRDMNLFDLLPGRRAGNQGRDPQNEEERREAVTNEGLDGAQERHARPVDTVKDLFEDDSGVVIGGLGDEEEAREIEQSGDVSAAVEEEERCKEEAKRSPGDEEATVEEPPHLVLVIHGIGQKLAEQWESFDFVYDVARFRKLSKRQARQEGVASIMGGRRAQFIPVCWRTHIRFENQEKEVKDEVLDNTFSLDDISGDKDSIPLVRTLISHVILDVPFYLSAHKQKMVEAVIAEANRMYRLFCQRNPRFAENPKVSIIAHSLGAALATDILSQQPNHVPPLASTPKEELETRKRFLFDTQQLFLVGSPTAFFLFLNKAQLIARSGRSRVVDERKGVTLDGRGVYGCLAVDSVYNVYNKSDPVAYRMNATVDSEYAKYLSPVPISSAVEGLLDTLALPRLSVTKFLQSRKIAFEPGSPTGSRAGIDARPDLSDVAESARSGGGGNAEESEGTSCPGSKGTNSPRTPRTRPTTRRDAELELEMEKLERAQQRFKALNPHGCLDFYLEPDSYEYLAMLSAHQGYWEDPQFSAFVLLQLFSSQRTLEAAGGMLKRGEQPSRASSPSAGPSEAHV